MLLLYILPLLLSAALGPILTLMIYRYRHAPGARALIALMLLASLWSLGYLAEIASPDLPARIMWAKFQYIGIAFLPLAWFAFATQYLGAPAWFSRWRKARWLLGLIPVITLGLAWTNERHSLIWEGIHLRAAGSVRMIYFDHGPWFTIFVIFTYALFLFGSFWLVSRLFSSNRLFRWQVGLAVGSAVIPWLGNLSYVTHLNPIVDVDWTPFGFSLAGALFSVSLFRFHLG